MDREKVIKGMELLYDRLLDAAKLDSIAMLDASMVANAIALLKEQEAQSVLLNRVCEVEPFRYVRKGFCPKCHQEMEWLFNRKHCGFCGQAVKWE